MSGRVPLPVDVDYSYSGQPTMVATHGLIFPPEFARKVFGGIVIMSREQFIAANGFSNDYWRWGFEDVDLRERLIRRGFRPSHREGVVRLLPHVDLGSNADGTPSEQSKASQALYISRWFVGAPGGWRRTQTSPHPWEAEGLRSINFEVRLPREPISGPAVHGVIVERVVVDFRSQGANWSD